MKQVLLRKGKIRVENVPAPALNAKNVLVEVKNSLISTGTEMASVKLSGSSLLTKAKERPKEIGKVIDSIRVRGLLKTLSLVMNKLDESKPLGYSCSGHVIAVGDQIKKFKVGDRVACAGAGVANHAEVVSVPENLTVKIPSEVDDASASFVTIGAIALQGVRRADVRLGETVCVMGLGLIGQITVQLLHSAGCRVVGMDPDKSRVDMALKNGLHFGTTDTERLKADIHTLTSGQGADATLITASTASSDPARVAFHLTRKKGKVVVVGAVGMDLERSPFYEKEQDFLISCSYGPGRYDPEYEIQGNDYPFAYVRWSENRNMESFLHLIAEKKINVSHLIENSFPIEESEKAYNLLAQEGRKPLSIVLSYPNGDSRSKHSTSVSHRSVPVSKEKIRLGLIGAGNFVRSTHLPNLKALSDKFEIAAVCTNTSASAETLSRQLSAPLSATDFKRVLGDSSIDAVLIATRHNKHAEIAKEALLAGKHVFLEKPLALDLSEMKELDGIIKKMDPSPVLMVGFNRRYAPAALQLKKTLSNRKGPLMAYYRVNAGALSPDHWVNTEEGGGRLRGEACHMVDFFQFIVSSPIQNFSISGISPSPIQRPDENFSAQITYEDGSVCTLIYTSIGNPNVPKERFEIHWNGMSGVLDDFSNFQVFGLPGLDLSGSQDKGHKNALQVFYNSIKSGVSFPISWENLLETTQVCIELDREVWGKTSDLCAES